jgi:hypothetical protein
LGSTLRYDDRVQANLIAPKVLPVFEPGPSFLSIFEDNLRLDLELLQVRPGDVTKIGYRDAQPIEILGVDFWKAPFITDFTVRHFLPRLLAGGLVLQRDFVHEFHPHIHLSMLRLADHFETFVELKWGGNGGLQVHKAGDRDGCTRALRRRHGVVR